VANNVVTVRVGVVPTYRRTYNDWCRKLHEGCLAAFAGVEGMEVVSIPGAPAGAGPDAETGATPFGCVNSLDEAMAAVAFFRREPVDAIIICPLDFGDERSASKVAEQLGVPVLLFASKEPPPRPDGVRTSDAYCGTLSIASGLHRRGIPFCFAGLFFPDEAEFVGAVQTFVRAASVVAGLRNARIGQVGLRPQQFETVAFDESAVVRKFGLNVITADIADVLGRAAAYSDDDPAVQAAIAGVKAAIATVEMDGEHLQKAARLECALAEFWETEGLSAMAARCWPTSARVYGCSVCSTFGRLGDRHMLVACESDVLGAIAMLISYRAALGCTVPHFIDWTIRHRERDDWLLAWHCGNASPCLAADPDRTSLSPDGYLSFQLKPGPVTFCRPAERDGHWKMLIARGRIVPSENDLGGTWSWVEVPDHDRLYRTLIEEGFIHHASMIHGDQVAALEQACRLLEIEPVLVI